MKGFIGFAAFLSATSVTASPLYVGKNGPVVKLEAGTAGMDPSIFRPLQARGQASSNAVTNTEDSHNRQVLEAYAAVAKLAVFEQDDAQLAKAFIPPMRKRQASKVTVTTTTTVPPAANVETVIATVTATASPAGASAEATQSSVAAEATKTSAAAESTKTKAAAGASKASVDPAASKTSADPAASKASADTATSNTSADTSASSTSAAAQATKASPSADASSSTTSSADTAATMNANANSNSTESTSSSTSSSAAGATAAANGGRTTFDNSQGVEVQIGSIQAAQASSATQTDIQPGDKGTDSTNATPSQQSVPDAANGGPLPSPTGPPNNGIGADAGNGQPPPQVADPNAQPTPQGADPNTQPSPPDPNAANTPPSPGPDVGPDAAPSPDAQAPADAAADMTRRSKHINRRDIEHQYQRRDRVLRERRIRRSGTLMYF